MPVALLSVPRTAWNRMSVAAALHGVEVYPEVPQGDDTGVALTGSVAKLQYTLNASGNAVRFQGLVAKAPRDPEPERNLAER